MQKRMNFQSRHVFSGLIKSFIVSLSIISGLLFFSACQKEDSPLAGVWEIESVTMADGSTPTWDYYGFFRPKVRWLIFRDNSLIIGGQDAFVSEYGIHGGALPPPGVEDWVYCPESFGYVHIRRDKIKASFTYSDEYELEGTYLIDGESLVIAWNEGTCVYKKVQNI